MDNMTESPLAFIWPNKSGPQFPMDTIAPSIVRPYPTSVSECVDDKLCLAQMLESLDIMPETIQDAKDAIEGELYFCKHRHGAQGKSVYVHDKPSLESWTLKCKNLQDFIIQKEVVPAVDERGHKFVLRGHLLVYKCGSGGTVHAGLHGNVICLSHALPYEPSVAASKAVHISQAGKRHPPPCLISELESFHPAANVFPLMQSCTFSFLKATIEAFNQPIVDGVTCFALLGADYLVSRDGEVKLCEINSHPALGWGSMKDVQKDVFARLVKETLDIAVFCQSLSETGFVPLVVLES